MKNKSKSVIPMLVIDDDYPYVEALNRDARRFHIALIHAGSLAEGKECFEGREGRSLGGVILDVKCLKERHQQVPDGSFIAAAVRYFGEKAPNLPMVALTGEPDQYRNMKELFAGTLRVFSKGRDEEEMLEFLREEAERLDMFRISASYPEVFAVTERYLGNDAEEELLRCLRDMESNDPTTIRNTLVCIRRFQERLYIALSKGDENLLPTRLVAGEINVVGCYKHLVENGTVERYRIIDRFAELTYKVTSDNGSHTPYADPKYPPTSYTVRAVMYTLLDLILWFGKEMERVKNR
jgi:hypothetical protein